MKQKNKKPEVLMLEHSILEVLNEKPMTRAELVEAVRNLKGWQNGEVPSSKQIEDTVFGTLLDIGAVKLEACWIATGIEV